jgi:hypothetical protein
MKRRSSTSSAIDLDWPTESEGSALLANLVAQRARLAQYAEQALADKQTAVAVACKRVTATNLEIVGKLLQRFVLRHEHRHQVLVDPTYLRLRQQLVTTLRRFPDAASAVARDLHAIESEAAAEIASAGKPVLIEQALAS